MSTPVEERLMRRVSAAAIPSVLGRRVDVDGECWLWTGALLPNGYGVIGAGGAHAGNVYVHRVSYEAHKGAIPAGAEIDHLCCVRNCVNPAHLEAVTRAENRQRQSDRQTHCRHGHEYTAANTIIRDGKRKCRECDRSRKRGPEYAARRRRWQSWGA